MRIMASPPDHMLDVHKNHDAMVVVNHKTGYHGGVGIRVCSAILSLTSDVFFDLLNNNPKLLLVQDGEKKDIKMLCLPQDDGDAMLTLMNMLHLREDSLPPRLSAKLVYGVAVLAAKYRCQKTVARMTWPWFDAFTQRINKPNSNQDEIFTMVQAALFLDEPVLFRRMTDLWIFEYRIGQAFHVASERYTINRLAKELKAQQSRVIALLREDFDSVVSCCVQAFGNSAKHLVDHEPGAAVDEDLNGQPLEKRNCDNDTEAAQFFLGSLSDNFLWPSNRWGKESKLGITIRRIAEYKIPEYDDSDRCAFCKDVAGQFLERVERMKSVHKHFRCWGLCLDCFKKGEDGNNGEDCRVRHRAFEPVLTAQGMF